ncbi:(Na+)-NQR maturation NqrM [Rosistilla oblonga]|uniref:(Na+)-NQR maturation NqrM n=1 Tax=Rosistilla oblonga TaxID=2527990 RepID=UPI001E490C3A|nr:(Na+)-NQR maturation NqrM [Rosistilla oblonga]
MATVKSNFSQPSYAHFIMIGMDILANSIGIVAQSAEVASETGSGSHVAVIVGITLAAFLLVCLGMAVGVMFGRRPISGSCGGLGNVTNESGEKSCALCQNPSEACKELRNRMTPAEEASEHEAAT